jgi:nitrite reductase/ring-hydroxylating ferredoxin subunit
MANWVDGGDVSGLQARGRRVFKAGKRQILLVQAGDRIVACNNRCPHEGYPLSEGTLADGCTLTCNWHNWKFDLASGDTLVGGDRLQLYPVEVRDGRILVDVSDVPAAQRQAKALANLAEAVEDDEYDRMAREVARFLRAGGDPHEPLRQAIITRAARFEYGMTHAFAAAADWLEIYDGASADAPLLLPTLTGMIAAVALPSAAASSGAAPDSCSRASSAVLASRAASKARKLPLPASWRIMQGCTLIHSSPRAASSTAAPRRMRMACPARRLIGG